MKSFFCVERFENAFNNLSLNKLSQIRLRVNYPIIIEYFNKEFYLSEKGASIDKKNSLIATKSDIDGILDIITENSLYSFNEEVKNGYITLKNGIRVGLGGKCVVEKEEVLTIKDIEFLNIRIPHLIKNVSNKIWEYIVNGDKVYNSLIISPPFGGKTTLLKDISLKINDIYGQSLLIIDERGEFSEISGERIDKISYSNKNFAFNNGIRSLSPKTVMTDELFGEGDFECVNNAVNSGVNIIASLHSDSIENVKKILGKFLYFERYIVLINFIKTGEFLVFDKNYNRI